MGRLWKVGLRWIYLISVAGILSIANGCGGGNSGEGDDNERDTTPDTISIAPQTGVALNAEVTSAPVTVTGINSPAPISVTNGSYSIDGGPFVTTPGTVTNNQTVRVRHTAADYHNLKFASTINIGGVTAEFASFTLRGSSQDISPDSFTFTPLTGASPGRSITSNAITVTGITTSTPILITDGTYSIEGRAFTSDPGSVSSGNVVMVRTTSSAANNSPATATLTIGDKIALFTVTTMQSGGTTTTPAAFSFSNMTSVLLGTTLTSTPITVSGVTAAEAPISVSGGSYSIGTAPFTSATGTVTNNQTVRVQHTSGSALGRTNETILNIGGVIGSFKSTTVREADTTADHFSFTSQTNVSLGAIVTSNQITVSGLDTPVPIRFVAGSYSIDNGTFTTAPGMVSNGQRVTVRHTAATTSNTTTITRLTIGGSSAQFSSSTGATVGMDTEPDRFTFAPLTNVPPNTEITSAPVTVTGIDAPAVIRIAGLNSYYSIDGGPFTSASGTVTNGQTVSIRHISASGYGNISTTYIYIGEMLERFTSTTQAAPQ